MRNKWRWNAAQFAERKWWQNYLRGKEVGEYLIWKKNYWSKLYEKCVPFFTVKQTDKVLDAGCGPAGIFMLFENNICTAFDPLLDEYEKDLPHFKKSQYPGVQFIKAGLENFVSEEKYHAIFCMNAINHVHDINASYDCLFKHAAPNAHVVITIDAHNHSIFKQLFRLLPGDILHPHQYDLKEYESMMTTRGCKILASICLKKEFFFDHYMLIGQMTS